MRERGERARTAVGECNGRARLTAETVRRIRAAHVQYRVTARMLAAQFGVNIFVVWKILKRVTWRGVEPQGVTAKGRLRS